MGRPSGGPWSELTTWSGSSTWNKTEPHGRMRPPGSSSDEHWVAQDIAPSPQPSATPTSNKPQAPTRAPRFIGPISVTAQPRDRACATYYYQGLCSSNSAHPADLHVCSYCLQSVQWLCKYTELYCKCKVLTTKWAGLNPLITSTVRITPPQCLPDPPAANALCGYLPHEATQ